MLPKAIARFLYTRPRLEAALSEIDKRALTLPIMSLERLFDNFPHCPVTFQELPLGAWSTPLIDIAMLLKVALCSGAKTVMELGSYRGYTALALARHLGPAGRIIAIDADPRHGESYRAGEFASRIERRVAACEPATFAGDRAGSIDLIYIDADHTYAGVKRDTELVRHLVSPHGFIVWHDYVNKGRFSRKNGVPDYLHELSRGGVPVARIAGTWLAIHCPDWIENPDKFRRALVEDDNVPRADPWTSVVTRG